MEAQYDEHCDECDGKIEQGDEITREGGDWIHEECAESGPPARFKQPATPGDELGSLMGGVPLGSGDLAERAGDRRAAAGYEDIANSLADERVGVVPLVVDPQPEYKSPDRWGRYVLGHPTRPGKRVTLSRCTTVIKAVDDMYNLGEWQKGNVVLGLSRRSDLLALAATLKPGDKSLKDLVKAAEEAGGGSEKANLGTALHGFTEMVDLGRPITDIPRAHQKDVRAYVDAMYHNRITVIPGAMERITMTSEWGGVAGKFDKVYRLADGSHVIGDVKTGKVGYDPKSMYAQLAMYAQGVNEVGVYNVAGACWERLPFEVRTDMALIVHLPAGKGECVVYEVTAEDMVVGRDHLEMCALVREHRKRKHPLTPYAPPMVAEDWWMAAVRMAPTRSLLALVGRAINDADAMTPALREVARERRESLPD